MVNRDFLDLLASLDEAGVAYVVVGAHALAAHGVVRATGDLDVFVRPDGENADRVITALHAFGAPLAAHQVTRDDFASPHHVYQMGLPPSRIDILTSISGIDFDTAWEGRCVIAAAGRTTAFLGRAELLRNKRAAARPKDLIDVQLLELHEPEGK